MRINATIPFLTFIPSIIATCSFITQQPNQYCHDLAQRCKISDADFFKYNPNIKKDCSNMIAGQKVCCNAGGLAPSPGKDGRCAVYEVKDGDNCGKIGGQYGLTIEQIDNFNFKKTTSFGGTWGFRGCQNLQPGKICISKGDKGPIPALQKDAQGNPVNCGPTASGNGTDVKCPLKACCNNWGQCGLTEEFCKVTDRSLNPGVSGCQDNCDIKFVKGDPPKQFTKVGYYETWNQKWPCLNSRIRNIDLSEYTHIHYSFADIDTNANVIMDNFANNQFMDFKSLTGVKKIVSFGGWGISTEPGTLQHLRLAVQNPDKYTDSLVKFAVDNKLDGVDIDWEYPGADVSGAPPGLSDDGLNYLNFLKMLRNKLPKEKSLSIAAPASFWYLKNFPIAEMSKYLDYIVFMTYDLHGQWDYNIKFTGPYLKSHVSWKETQSMLDLITHAGVPSNKVLLGIAKYGRSFQQVDPSCDGSKCKFTGPESGATPGKCTDTAGYMGLGEIKEIIKSEKIRKNYVEDGSQILVWGKDQWVAYLTDEQIKERTDKAKSMNLGGTITWALDLDSKESINECDLSNVVNLDDLSNTVCKKQDLRDYFVSYIQDAIDQWNNHSAHYEEGITEFKKYYNITDPHPPKSDFDKVYNTMLKFIQEVGDKTDDRTISLLFFYAKRCAVFYDEEDDDNKLNKRELRRRHGFGPRGEYIPLEDMSRQAAKKAIPAARVGLRIGARVGALALQAVPFVGEVIGAGLAIADVFITLWNMDSKPIPESVIKLAQGNEKQLNKIEDLIMNPNYVDDYYNSITSVDYGFIVDPAVDEIIPGPYTKLTSVVLQRINSPYYWKKKGKTTDCKTDDRVNVNNEQYEKLSTKLKNKKKKEKNGIPVYWINYYDSGQVAGPSPGVACNSWYYFSKKMLSGTSVDKINEFTIHGNGGKERKWYLDKYNCGQYGKKRKIDKNGKTYEIATHDKDEFPFAEVNEGEIVAEKEYYVSVACVRDSDNRADGSYFGQFVAAQGRYAVWNDHVIGKPSGSRRGPLGPNDPFIIKIYDLPQEETCPGFAKDPDGTNRRPNVINHFFESIN